MINFKYSNLKYLLYCLPTKPLLNIDTLIKIIFVLSKLIFARFNKYFYNTIQIKYFLYCLISFLALLILCAYNIYYFYTLLFFAINLSLFVYINYINKDFHRKYPNLYKGLNKLTLICMVLSALILLHGIFKYINVLTSKILDMLKDFIIKVSGGPTGSGGSGYPSESGGPSGFGNPHGPEGPNGPRNPSDRGFMDLKKILCDNTDTSFSKQDEEASAGPSERKDTYFSKQDEEASAGPSESNDLSAFWDPHESEEKIYNKKEISTSIGISTKGYWPETKARRDYELNNEILALVTKLRKELGPLDPDLKMKRQGDQLLERIGEVQRNIKNTPNHTTAWDELMNKKGTIKTAINKLLVRIEKGERK